MFLGFFCICNCTYLHTPWFRPAGQSLQGTYQSNVLCVGKSLTCTWCRSLCWNRTHSSLSCTLEEREEEESLIRAGVTLIWSWLKAEGFREGGSWKDYCTFSHPQQKSAMPLWFASLWGSSVFQKVCFSWADFLSSYRCLENWQCERSSFPSKTLTWKWTRNGHNFLHQDKTAVFGGQLAFPATPCYWRMSSVTYAEKCEPLCHPAPTLHVNST